MFDCVLSYFGDERKIGDLVIIWEDFVSREGLLRKGVKKKIWTGWERWLREGQIDDGENGWTVYFSADRRTYDFIFWKKYWSYVKVLYILFCRELNSLQDGKTASR